MRSDKKMKKKHKRKWEMYQGLEFQSAKTFLKATATGVDDLAAKKCGTEVKYEHKKRSTKISNKETSQTGDKDKQIL